MPETKAHPAPSTFRDHANVVQLPPEAKPVGLASKSAVRAAAEQAIEFHENVAAYHRREAEKIRTTLSRLTQVAPMPTREDG